MLNAQDSNRILAVLLAGIPGSPGVALEGRFLVMSAGGVLACLLAVTLAWVGYSKALQRTLGKRFAHWLDPDLSKSTARYFNQAFSTINEWLESRLRKGWARRMVAAWRLAWFGARPLSAFVSAAGAIGLGVIMGRLFRLSEMLIVFCTACMFLGLGFLTISRARKSRERFQVQFPEFLGKMSDALDAGFSLLQAVDFILPNLSEPIHTEMIQLSTQIHLGYTQSEAWDLLAQRQSSEDVVFFVEGLLLQRQVGGNLPRMMRNLEGYISQRAELAKEIKTMTAQGRLSAIVISGLVPVSLGLLAFFPGYVDVLFHTTAGNIVLMFAGTLQLIGAGMVRQLIRIKT